MAFPFLQLPQLRETFNAEDTLRRTIVGLRLGLGLPSPADHGFLVSAPGLDLRWSRRLLGFQGENRGEAEPSDGVLFREALREMVAKGHRHRLQELVAGVRIFAHLFDRAAAKA